MTFILDSIKRKTAYKRKEPVKIFWWRYEYPDKLNFGDEITPFIVERLFNVKVIWAQPDDCHLVSTGSIIEVVQQLKFENTVRIWGSGFINEASDFPIENMVFLAVRKKLTRNKLNNNSLPLGDPGLLAPLVYKNKISKLHKIGIVPHYVDYDSDYIKEILDGNENVLIINPLWPVGKVIDSIKSCESIISSSLHGLIIADAFGIPNQRIQFSNKLTGGDYKFLDYYSAFEKRNYKLETIDASSMKNLDLINSIKNNYIPIPKDELLSIQKCLIKSLKEYLNS